MAYELVKSLIFGVRNADKVVNSVNDQGRIFADAGQFTKAAKAAAELDNAVGRGASAAVNAIKHTNNAALEKVAKGVNWASNNVNPLLIGAAGYRVIMADDKEHALKREILGMTSMFAAEAVIKDSFKTQAWQRLLKSMHTSPKGIIGGMIQGILFVAGSVAASIFGCKAGDKLFAKKDKKTTVTLKDEIAQKELEKLTKRETPNITLDEYKAMFEQKPEHGPALIA